MKPLFLKGLLLLGEIRKEMFNIEHFFPLPKTERLISYLISLFLFNPL